MRHAFFYELLKISVCFFMQKSLVRNVIFQIPSLFLKKSQINKIFIFRIGIIYIMLIINDLYIYILNFYYYLQ